MEKLENGKREFTIARLHSNDRVKITMVGNNKMIADIEGTINDHIEDSPQTKIEV